jgi:hypothetical protein
MKNRAGKIVYTPTESPQARLPVLQTCPLLLFSTRKGAQPKGSPRLMRGFTRLLREFSASCFSYSANSSSEYE